LRAQGKTAIAAARKKKHRAEEPVEKPEKPLA
jgi:hypothetical protein